MKTYWIIISIGILLNGLQAQETITFDIPEQYRLANEAISANQYQKGLKHIFECHRSDVNNLDYLNKLGYCYFQLGNYSEAKYAFLASLKLDSLNIHALSNLAAIFDMELNYGKARQAYDQLILLDSTNSYYYKKNAAIAQKTSNHQL